MAGKSYEQFRTLEEAESYCNSMKLKMVRVTGDFVKVAKLLNENEVEVAYLTTRDKAYVSNLSADTKWVVILD